MSTEISAADEYVNQAKSFLLNYDNFSAVARSQFLMKKRVHIT